MRVSIRKKNFEITPAFREYAENKIVRSLERLLKDTVSKELPILDLEFVRTTVHHHKGKVFHAEANLSLGRNLIHAEADDEDMRIACDILERVLRREIMVYKNRSRATGNRIARRLKKDLRLDPAAQFPIERASPHGWAARMPRKGRIIEEGN